MARGTVGEIGPRGGIERHQLEAVVAQVLDLERHGEAGAQLELAAGAVEPARRDHAEVGVVEVAVAGERGVGEDHGEVAEQAAGDVAAGVERVQRAARQALAVERRLGRLGAGVGEGVVDRGGDGAGDAGAGHQLGAAQAGPRQVDRPGHRAVGRDEHDGIAGPRPEAGRLDEDAVDGGAAAPPAPTPRRRRRPSRVRCLQVGAADDEAAIAEQLERGGHPAVAAAAGLEREIAGDQEPRAQARAGEQLGAGCELDRDHAADVAVDQRIGAQDLEAHRRLDGEPAAPQPDVVGQRGATPARVPWVRRPMAAPTSRSRNRSPRSSSAAVARWRPRDRAAPAWVPPARVR